MRLALVLYFICFFANASCSISNEQFEDWNKQFSYLFEVEKHLNKNNYSFVATLPKQIEAQAFNAAGIFRDSLDNPSFFTVLKAHKENGELKVWFTLSAQSNEKYFLSFSYGDDCGLSVSIPITVK